VPRTEEAFYLRLQAFSQRARLVLRDSWALRDDWALLGRLCRFWGVARRPTCADRAERAFWQREDAQMRLPFPR
jgi:hypothetical protein